jgi:hypothetical protein
MEKTLNHCNLPDAVAFFNDAIVFSRITPQPLVVLKEVPAPRCPTSRPRCF